MYNKIFLFSGDQPERLTEMRKVRCERKGWGLGGVASLNFKSNNHYKIFVCLYRIKYATSNIVHYET